MQTAISTYGRVELNELPPKVPDVAAAEVLVLEAEFNPVDLRRLPLDRPQPDLLPRRERKGLGHCAQHREAQRSPELLGLLLGDAQHQVHADMLSCSRGGGRRRRVGDAAAAEAAVICTKSPAFSPSLAKSSGPSSSSSSLNFDSCTSRVCLCSVGFSLGSASGRGASACGAASSAPAIGARACPRNRRGLDFELSTVFYGTSWGLRSTCNPPRSVLGLPPPDP